MHFFSFSSSLRKSCKCFYWHKNKYLTASHKICNTIHEWKYERLHYGRAWSCPKWLYIKEYWRLKVNWKNDVLMGTYMILLRFQLPCISISKIINHDNSLSGYKSFVHNPVPNATVTLFLFFKIRLWTSALIENHILAVFSPNINRGRPKIFQMRVCQKSVWTKIEMAGNSSLNSVFNANTEEISTWL